MGEMANLLAGHATAKFEALGKNVQISPPTIVSGAGVDYKFPPDALNALITLQVEELKLQMIVSFRS
jgi:CheY-specific phosphatase CheX